MKISGMMKSAAAALLILSVVATTAFAGPQKKEQVQVLPQGERYAYVWVAGSRIPQKVKISPVGTLTHSPLWEWDRRKINQTRAGTVEGVLKQDPSLSIRLGRPGGGF